MSQRGFWEFAVVFIQNGGRGDKRKMNQIKRVESNPAWGRNQHSKAGIYSGRVFSLSGSKENYTPLPPVSCSLSVVCLCGCSCVCARLCVCVCVCMLICMYVSVNVYVLVCGHRHICMRASCLTADIVNLFSPLTCCEREVAISFLISSFIHLIFLLLFFSQNQSPTT